MSHTHLTTTERVKIKTYLELGMSIRSIARRLGRQPSTVSREIRRNPDYESRRAQGRYEKAKTNCGVKTNLDDTMRRTIVGKLRATWSPEQIVGRLYAGKIAFSTIYRWIYAGRRRRTGAKSSAVTSASKRRSACQCISPTRTHRGNRGATRTPTVSSASFSRKEQTSRGSRMTNLQTRSPKSTGDQESA